MAPKKVIPTPLATEAEKRKAGEAAEEPEAKQQKTEEGEAKTPEEPKEKEVDAPADKRQSLGKPVVFQPFDLTLNAMPVLGGKMLTMLSDGGLQFLIAGARSNVGMKSGRYVFEVKVVQTMMPLYSSQGGKSRAPIPRQLVRVGFSKAGSSLILGDSEDSVCFDAEGFFTAAGRRTAGSWRFAKDQVIAVVLNLDQKSENANTVSLFKDGERVSEPKPLPDNLKGQALFPHVAYRNVSLQVNFGPNLLKELPFKCRSLQTAATADTETTAPKTRNDGKFELLVPVGLPDEGTFDWLDSFLEENGQQYAELSDRKLIDWAQKSGLWKNRATTVTSSNDKPEFNFGLPDIDSLNVHKVLNAVVTSIPRNLVLMEVRANLIPAERKAMLKRFNPSYYKRIACVVMGEPGDDYKKVVKSKLLKSKQEKAVAAWKVKKAEDERKKLIAQQQKRLAEQKAKAEAAQAASIAASVPPPPPPPPGAMQKKEEEEKKEEAAKEGEAKEEKKEEEKEAEEAEEEDAEPPTVELTEEEGKTWFLPKPLPDVTPALLGTSCSQFSLPQEEEGFDAIRYMWQEEQQSVDYMKQWVQDKRLTSRIEGLMPGAPFKEKLAEYQQKCEAWKAKQKAYQQEEASKESGEKEEPKEPPEKKEGEEGEGKVPEPDLDIFAVEDVDNIGNGEPLYAKFLPEDWALLLLRVECYLMTTYFKQDAGIGSEEELGIHESNIGFYYARYFQKQLHSKLFGFETIPELLSLVKDTVTISAPKKVLTRVAEESNSFDGFLKMAEENRRERQRRIDAGDETARLKYNPAAVAALVQPMPLQQNPAAAAAAAAAMALGGKGGVLPGAMVGQMPLGQLPMATGLGGPAITPLSAMGGMPRPGMPGSIAPHGGYKGSRKGRPWEVRGGYGGPRR